MAGLDRVDIGSLRHEVFDHVFTARLHGTVEGRNPEAPSVRILAALYQRLGVVEVALPRREQKCRHLRNRIAVVRHALERAMQDQPAPSRKENAIPSGVVSAGIGVLLIMGGLIYAFVVRVGAASIRGAGQQQGSVAFLLPLLLGGTVFVGHGIHKVLWAPPRHQAPVPHAVRGLSLPGSRSEQRWP